MERELARLLPYILGGMFILGLLLFLLALQQLRVRRTGQHWRTRRRAGDRGGRLFLISIGLMVSSVVVAIITGIVTLVYRNNNSNEFLNRGPDNLYGIVLSPETLLTATAQSVAQAVSPFPSSTEAAAVPATDTPPSPIPASATVSDPPTLTLTPTFSPTATQTETPTMRIGLNLTAVFNTTPRPASASATLTVDAVSDQYSASAPSAGQQFNSGIKRIYVYVSYDQMDNGVAWSRVLYCNGAALQGDTLLWSLGSSGSSYFFFGDQAGYRAGSYEVRLFVGKQEVSHANFKLVDGRET